MRPQVFTSSRQAHDWLRRIRLAFVSASMSPLLATAASNLLDAFRALGHVVQDAPDNTTDLLLTTAPFARPLNWRQALLFTARRRFDLDHVPTVLTLIHALPAEFHRLLDHLGCALRKSPPEPADFAFEGLAPSAFETLVEQGKRGGPILALERVLQAQAKSLRILLLVGEDHLEEAYLFDLVGAHPRFLPSDEESFYRELVLRIATVISTKEITEHRVTGELIPVQEWRSIASPGYMVEAAGELGRRQFFTPTVKIADLVAVPSIPDMIADQYSEGCFATWEPRLSGLISTVTGSARPLDKNSITPDDLSVIVGIREDGRGALVRHVEGHRNDPPSSEAVEMFLLDRSLPTISTSVNGQTYTVPVVRSKLHGHRGVAAYDPEFVEFVPLDEPYYHYPVSCATEAQAHGIYRAFSRAECLRFPEDPRQVAFTILPGHGVVIVEKWVADKRPFQVMWEYMDAGYLEIQSRIPQGALTFVSGADGRRHLTDMMENLHADVVTLKNC